jgi:outer membrane lipoprotein-sorting protein
MGTTNGVATTSDERPQREHGIQLLGEMPAAGYVDRQWLVQHGDRFLQMAELPYRVLELSDGQRTLQQIADELTETTEWAVQPSNVQHVIDRKLRVPGLVAHGDGLSALRDHDRPRAAPLQLSLRMKLLPQRLVDGLTDIFQHLYTPWVLVLLAVLMAISHWWLYVHHGVARSLENVLYLPGGMLAVVALGIIAGLFHEMGHASALKYGGGRPRGIGFGLYLFYPAFYSDVTDAYRLARAARVRTDLGGIYFHLIFASALISVAAFTGSSFLLAAALLFNIEALRQFIPFVRLDGYWLLADLTGIPDLFSQAVPFARRLWPHRFKGAKLPALKPWATTVFAVYLLITIPVLVYAFVMMLRHVPELVEHTVRALAFHFDVVRGSMSFATKLLSATQMMLLPVPLAATAYFLYSLALTALAAVSLRRVSARAIRLAVAPACAAILLFTVTALGWSGSSRSRGADMLAETRTNIERIRTLEADVRGAIGRDEFHGRLTLSRPNRARVEINGGEAVGAMTVIADGKTVYVNFPNSAQYTAARAAADGTNINAFLVDQVRLFFVPARLTNAGAHEQVRYRGRERIGHDEVDVVEIAPADAQGVTWRYFISAEGLVRRVVAATPGTAGQVSIRWVELENLRTNHNIVEKTFHWEPVGKRLGLGDLGVDLSAGRRAK